MILMTSTNKIELSDDIISHLCDDVLCHVLSFVPTKDSVATSVLSKRWKHLWESVPNLHFDDDFVPTLTFASFVDRALSLKTKKLSELSLRCSHIGELYNVSEWVSNSITRNIQSLKLIIYEARYELPSSMFTCKTLESLTLEGLILLIVPTLVCLPKLRTLKLVEIEYEDEDCPSRLISSCSSSLELVLIHYTRIKNYSGICNISHAKFQPQILRHLDLRSNCDSKIVKVPSYVFTCQSLEKLSLDGSFFICSAPSISLPNLTILKLHSVVFEDDQILNRLASSCTSLESLNVMSSTKAVWNISSSTLKVIKLDLAFHSNPPHKLVINAPSLKHLKLRLFIRSNPCLKLVINAPSLKRLKLDSCEATVGKVDCHIEDLASLEQAYVAISFDRAESLINFYKALWHVKSLRIMVAKFKGCDFGGALPMFDRLTDLDIHVSTWNYDVFLDFINNSTKLENLTLKVSSGHNWKDPSSVPACLLTSLRSVSIGYFSGEVGEIQMVKYILRNARILKIMRVRFNCNINNFAEVKKKMRTELSNACRGSEKCVVLI